ncbi:MAG: hypothetical protein ABSF93_09590 [Candidatus Sulfotelmatobacter sp.]|jgi:hypothetical protein
MHHSAPSLLRSAVIFLCALAALASAQAVAQSTAPTPSPLARHYTEGEKLTYHMKGNNDGWTYEVQANGVVKKDVNGRLVEEYGWSDFKSNASMSLSPQSLGFRQTLSLDPAIPPSVPNLSQVQPFLIGPITDMLTFYADLWLAIQQTDLKRPGDHAYVRVGTPASWADGNYVILGEDSIDFDLTLKALDTSSHVATLLVRHVPPSQPKVKLPAPWMQTPVADTPNNWIDVKGKNNDGKYVAAVGKETFEVEIEVSLQDGKIRSATLDNVVKTHQRECSDAALLTCGDPSDHQIHRQIEIQLEASPK